MTNLSFQPPNTIHFEVKIENSGQLQLTSLVPGDDASAQAVVQAVAQTQPFAGAWDSEYRSLHVLSGASAQPVTTLEDVQAIAVPSWRRLRGTLANSQLTLTEHAVSDDGETWRPLPQYDEAAAQNETAHPAFLLPGEVLGRFTTLQWREGRIDTDPDPAGDLLELLEYGVQLFNGAGDDAWKARHEQFGGDPRAIPAAKRVTFELRKLAPLFSRTEPPFWRQGGVEFWPLIPLEYTQDGKKWQAYTMADAPLPVLEAAEEGDSDPMSLLSQLFDMQVATVTVGADGKVEWDDGDIPDEHADALRQSIQRTLGAGQPGVWAERLRPLLPSGEDRAPTAVRLQVMKALLDSAPGMLDQAYAPSAYTLGGGHWVDLAPDFDEAEEEGP